MTAGFELTLFYQGVHYRWAELCREMADISPDKEEASLVSGSLLLTAAENRFLTTLYLLRGFHEQWTVFPVSSDYSDVEKNNLLQQIAVKSPAENLLAIATSGSQAEPKIALISKKNIVSHCQSFQKIIPLNTTSVWLNCLPMHHIAGVMIVYRCWFHNAAMLLHDNFDVEKIWDDIHSYPVTHISLVPRMLSKLLDYSQGKSLPESMQTVLVGGDALSETIYQRSVDAGWPVLISYGMTEATSTVAIGKTQDALKLLDGLDVQLTTQDTLKIKGPMIMSGYAGLKTTAKADADNQHNGWFETNDLAVIDSRCLSISGRNDHMIISGGNNIAPEHIEEILLRSPFADDIAIGKIMHPEWGCSIAALVCGDIEQLKQWVECNVESYKQPRYYINVKTLPRNELGKINRLKVQEIILHAELKLT